MTDIEKVKDNIRAMFNLAKNDAAAEGEVRNAMKFAQRLMEEHHISTEDLESGDEKALDLENAEFTKATTAVNYWQLLRWQGQLAMWVCDFVGGVRCYKCHDVERGPAGGVVLNDKGNPKRSAAITFYGIAEDVEIAKTIFNEIILAIPAMARLRFGHVFRAQGREYCEGFRAGFVPPVESNKG